MEKERVSHKERMEKEGRKGSYIWRPLGWERKGERPVIIHGSLWGGGGKEGGR